VAQSEGVQFGIVVDSIFNIQDVVVKPLGPLLNNLPKYAGATILGSGRVSLIIDVDGIATESGLIGKVQPNIIAPVSESNQILEGEMAMLLFELNGLSRIAAPLGSIEHILMLSEDQFQENGNKEVVYYQDQLMHVIRLEDYVSGCEGTDSTGQAVFPALTCHINHKTYALIVKQVYDIIEVPTKMHELSSPQRGIEGCVIYKDEVINVLDLEEVLAMHNAHDSSTVYPRVIDIQGVMD
jgi:two-component system chemotaxis sensor kinase CheA